MRAVNYDVKNYNTSRMHGAGNMTHALLHLNLHSLSWHEKLTPVSTCLFVIGPASSDLLLVLSFNN